MRRWTWLLVTAVVGGCATGTTESDENDLDEDDGAGGGTGGLDPQSGSGAASSNSSTGAGAFGGTGSGGDPSTSATTSSSSVATTTVSSGTGGGGGSDRIYFMHGGGTATVGSYTDLTLNTGWATPFVNDPTVDPLGVAALTGGTALALIRRANGELKVSYHAGGMTWSVPTLLATAAPGGSSVVGEGTKAHAMYLNGSTHTYAHYDSGTWTVVAESTGSLTSATPASAAITLLASDPVILFVGPDGELYDRTRSGGLWSAANPHDLVGSVASAKPALVAMDAGPELLAVFVDEATDEVRWTERSGSVWSAPAAVPGATSAEALSMVALPTGEAVLAWRGTDQKSYSARFTGSWSAAADVTGNGGPTICPPVVARGAVNAEAELVFVDAIGGVYWTRLNGASWSPPEFSGVSSPPSCTSIAVSPP